MVGAMRGEDGFPAVGGGFYLIDIFRVVFNDEFDGVLVIILSNLLLRKYTAKKSLKNLFMNVVLE